MFSVVPSLPRLTARAEEGFHSAGGTDEVWDFGLYHSPPPLFYGKSILHCTIHQHLCSMVNLYNTQTVPFLFPHHITNVFHVYLFCVSTRSKHTPPPSYSTARPSTSMRDSTPLMGYLNSSRYAFYNIYINMTH